MILTLDTERLRTLEEIRTFMEGNRPMDFRSADRADAYEFVRRTLVRFRYGALDKPSKGLLKEYLGKVTGLSRAKLTRLIGPTGQSGASRTAAAARRGRLSGATWSPTFVCSRRSTGSSAGGAAATRRVLQRQFEVFGDLRFERLAGLSNSHLYRLRQTTTYRRRRTPTTKTRPVQVAIGERRSPHPGGRPSFLRVDSVHQGDLDGEKGIYLVNVVDEVSQYKFVGAVEAISEAFLLPVLERLIDAFPFRIMDFHTDNGSEYINHRTARLLDKLHVEEFTKSRPQRSNDNALVESKNGTVVRRHLGHAHIPRRHAARVKDFTHHVLSLFLNYHRPCHFPVETVGDDGRTTKRHPYANVATPYDKLKSLDHAERFLKPGVSFAELNAFALSASDLDAAVNAARAEMFRAIARDETLPQADARCCPERRYGPSSLHLGNIPSPT